MKRKALLTSILLLGIIISFSLCLTTDAKNPEDPEDPKDPSDDDGEDFAKDLAYVSIGLFATSAVTISIYFTNKYSRKLLKGEGKPQEVKKRITKTFLKIRKPLSYIHYIVGFGALTVLFIHGIYLSTKDETLVAIGWVTASIYIYYVVSGMIIWLKIKPIWNYKKAIRIMNKIHRSFILFASIVIIHIIHVILAD